MDNTSIFKFSKKHEILTFMKIKHLEISTSRKCITPYNISTVFAYSEPNFDNNVNNLDH